MICDVKPMKKIRDERVYDAKQVIHIGLNNPESPSAVLDDQWWSDAKTPSQEKRVPGRSGVERMLGCGDIAGWAAWGVSCSSVAACRRLPVAV